MPERPGRTDRDDVSCLVELVPIVALAILCVLAFAVLAWQLEAGGLTAFDGVITGWIQAEITPGLTSWMILITGLGSLGFVAALTALAAIFLCVRREWGDGLAVAAASLSSWALNSCLKLIFQRPRPDLPHLVPAGGYSFPSAHATVAAALFFTLAVVYCRHSPSGAGRASAMAAAALLALLVGISRVDLGVHYPSDVVAGWALGGLLAMMIAVMLRLRGDVLRLRLPSYRTLERWRRD